MQGKQIIASFCLLVLTFQLLPVRQLGSLLFNNRITKELLHNDDTSQEDCKDKLCFKKDFTCCHAFIAFSFLQKDVTQYTLFNVALLPFPAAEVRTPPPDIA